MRSAYAEIPYDDALTMVLAALAPLAPVSLGLDDALGLVLATDIVADAPMPPFAASSKDGFAVQAADGLAPRRLIGTVTAGQVSGTPVVPGTALRITTGAPIPPGADAVVMVEDTDVVDAPTLLVRRAVAPGENLRRAGEDYLGGETLLPAGTVLGPAASGLAASVGAATLRVIRRPRVAIFSTGDELVEPDAIPGPGQIRDANRIALVAAAREAGAEVVMSGRLRDADADLGQLNDAVASADAVISSGGVSMGHLDLVKPWLAAAGEVRFGRARIKPGKPMTFGLVDGTPVFALPGFPVSTLVCFELFVRPALRRLAGHPDVSRPQWSVRLQHGLAHPADRTEFVRAHAWLDADGRAVAATTGAQTSGRLMSLASANALLRLPEGDAAFSAGDEVTALILGDVRPATLRP